MNVLGIESSCDETGVALVRVLPGDCSPCLLAQSLHSQVDMHQAYGGVVPELASRDHIRRVVPLTREVMSQARLRLADVDLVAYTAGPGLAGALLVGAGLACSLASALGKPALGVHHLEGHLLSPFLSANPPLFPFVALLVSGGHTQLMHVHEVGMYQILGETIDDAAGEAFDKSAKLMGLPYPGGPALAELAKNGDPQRFPLPRPLMHDRTLNFSFAGLKTAVRTVHQRLGASPVAHDLADLAAATQAAIVDVLVSKSMAAVAATGLSRLVVAGGVGANAFLRSELGRRAQQREIQVHYPELAFCTDNGAMIALAGAMRWQRGLESPASNGVFSVLPRWPLATHRGIDGSRVAAPASVA